MTTFTTITSQGQITIPAHFRRLLGLSKSQKAIINIQDNKLIIEPTGDILKSSGVFKKYKLKGKTINQTLKEEEQAFGKFISRKYSHK